MSDYKFDTVKVRGGYNSREHNNSVAVPIYATAAYDFDGYDHFNGIRAGAQAGYLYTRVEIRLWLFLKRESRSLTAASPRSVSRRVWRRSAIQLSRRRAEAAEFFPQSRFTAYARFILLAYFGAALSPYDAQLILIGLETLSKRVSKQVANTRKVAEYLKTRTDAVSWVSYPELEESVYKPLANKYFPNGAGMALTFGFKGNDGQLNELLKATRIFGYQVNVGDAKSLIVNSPKTTHGELRPDELADADILPETIRLSLGLEDADDLIADLEQAFSKAGFEK